MKEENLNKMGVCGFCETFAELQESHVIPAFVFKWLRKRSGTGHIRHSDSPNRRVQDGLKFPWLCEHCEGKFSRYETAFANKVFYPWQTHAARTLYKEWLLKFCVSVSWRVLKHARGHARVTPYTDEQQKLLDQAEIVWRAFLNDQCEHPGAFEQHLVFFDFATSTDIRDLPNNFNRFMTGAINFDIVGSENSVQTFAKLGRFQIIGIIQKGPNRWEGTKVHVKHGILKPGKIVLPREMLDLYRTKAASIETSFEEISPQQNAKIKASVQRDMERFRDSDQFRAIEADAKLFGIDAVRKKTTD
ncbi:MAG: hypothetical protein ACPGSI_11320 [Pikeienuella sp.]